MNRRLNNRKNHYVVEWRNEKYTGTMKERQSPMLNSKKEAHAWAKANRAPKDKWWGVIRRYEVVRITSPVRKVVEVGHIRG